jgi:hypothetical protein
MSTNFPAKRRFSRRLKVIERIPLVRIAASWSALISQDA